MTRHLSMLISLLLITMLGPVSTARSAEDATAVLNPPPTAKDWADIGKLPDLSGLWIADMKDQFAQVTSNPTPWTTKAADVVNRQTEDNKAGRPDNIFLDCLPEGMPTWMLINHSAMEIAVTPGKIYMLGESDSNRLRRIYTDGRPHPDDPDQTFHGHSIGHWEGDTLVVDTVGILPQVWLAIGEAQGVHNNGDTHVVERIRLAGPNTLTDTLTITAPHVLTKPWVTTRRFERTRRRDFDIVEGICLEGSFTADTDKDGNAIFKAVPRTADGNRAPAN